MPRITMVLVGALLISGDAVADDTPLLRPMVLQVTASGRQIGCSRHVPRCEGIVTSRLGLSVVNLGWKVSDRLAVVGMFQAAGRPRFEGLESQMLVGAGPRLSFGDSWVQAGVGIGATRIGPNPKTITSMQLLAGAEPAVLGGVGTIVDVEGPTTLSVDASAAFEEPTRSEIYQLTVSASRFF